jgi:endonuclease V-like protein UPF0215 family
VKRPHLLGVDDGPHTRGQRDPVPIVGVMMEGAQLLESVAITHFPVDGEDVTRFLAEWIEGLRLHPTLDAVILGGITIAGLAVVDACALATALDVPVLVATRRDPSNHRVPHALEAAGLGHRIPLLAAAPPTFEVRPGLWIGAANVDEDGARELLASALNKAKLPEPLRAAHLIARAIVDGESRGRV